MTQNTITCLRMLDLKLWMNTMTDSHKPKTMYKFLENRKQAIGNILNKGG